MSNSGIMFGVSQISGYLNLLANCIDNFTHGLAVAGSFLVSKKVRGCDNPNKEINTLGISIFLTHKKN